MTDLVDAWRARVARGELQYDEAQLRACYALRDVLESLKDYAPTASQAELMELLDSGASRKSFASVAVASLDRSRQRQLVRVLSEDDELQSLSTPTGFLLTGPPGTGHVQRARTSRLNSAGNRR